MRQIRITKSITARTEDSIFRYLQEISQCPLISSEEEVSLALKIQTGDQAALERLVKANLRFVVSVAKKHTGQGMPLADLISEGNKGLIKAARRFDPTRGIKFISFSVWWIRQSILLSLNEHKRMIRLPGNQINERYAVVKSVSVLEQELERRPNEEEISLHSGVPIDKIKMQSWTPSNTFSYDAFVDDEDTSMLNFIPDVTLLSPDTILHQKDCEDTLEALFSVLSERQRRILDLNFGLNGNEPMTIKDIAVKFGASLHTVQFQKKKALELLRKSPNVHQFKRLMGQ